MYEVDWQETSEILGVMLGIVQIAFYLSAATVAWLTFAVARKGLLSPVNTEYQKRVMDRLAEVATELGREWDPIDQACYVHHFNHIDIACKDIRDQVEKYQRDKVAPETIGIIVSPLETRLTKQFNRWRSDPFVPDDLRHELLSFTVARANAYGKVYFSELGKYRKALLSRTHDASRPSSLDVANAIHARLAEAGWGIDNVAAKVDVLRLKLRSYMQRFDPHRRKTESLRVYSPTVAGRSLMPDGSRLIRIVGDQDTAI